MAGLCLGIVGWAFIGVLAGSPPMGDGGDPATYGFDLDGVDLDGRVLVASGNPRDFLQPLDMPRVAPGRDIPEINRAERGKYLVSADRVIGVEIEGQARAYPLRLMNAHEVCNDELAGVPIAVTYSPLCDSVVVFDRRIALPGGKVRTVRLGVSGLLLDSNLLMYDRDERGPDDGLQASDSGAGQRSLWSQLLARAVTGPDAASAEGAPLRLRALPGVQLVPWSVWLERRPETSVALRDAASALRIKRIDYGRYWANGEPLFPIGCGPDPADLARRGLNLMSRAVRIERGESSAVLVFDEIAGQFPGGQDAVWFGDGPLAEHPVRLTLSGDRSWAWIDGGDAVVVHGRVFALECPEEGEDRDVGERDTP